jgi:hypothetical protein
LKDIEIFYTLDTESVSPVYTEIDYAQENNSSSITLPNECRRLKIGLKFYQEAYNKVNMLFRYAFTQNSDKGSQKQVMTQAVRKTIRLNSQSPFKVEWNVRTADPYLQNLKLQND